jgi:feruloyl esterase
LFDPVQILEAWVERDAAPSHIITRDQLDPEAATATALLCPYPQRALHDGRGPTTSAESYRCVEAM